MVEFEKVDMDEFIAGCVQRFCSVCGKEIRQKETGRPRKFCSDPCRRRYWKAHPKPEHWDSYHEQVCPDIADGYDDTNWAQDRFRKYVSGELQVGKCSGAPRSGISDLRQAHQDISIIQTVQDTVPDPKPYEKLDEAHTYSPGCAEFEDIELYPNNKGYGDPIY